MKRCTSNSFATLAASLCVLTAPLAFTAPAGAQTSDSKPGVRSFPAAAKRGEMVVKNHPIITINGRAEQLSPGARIFNQNNLVVLSGQLVDQELVVNYLRDGGGQIHQVWILNSEEVREKRAGSTATIFNFITGDAPDASSNSN